MTEKKLVLITPENKMMIDYIIDEFHLELEDWMVLNGASIVTYISDETAKKVKELVSCTISPLEAQ